VSSDTAEADLIAKATSGDRIALQQLLLKHSARLTRHIGTKLPDSVRGVIDADDVLQQTFLDVFRDIERFEPGRDQSFVAWLKTIAAHRAQDMVKALKRVKRGGQHQRAGADRSASMNSLVAMLSAGSHTPSRSVARHEAVDAIERAIRDLPDEYGRAVQLRLIDGQSLEATAAQMNRSPRAIQGLVDRAKKKMRAALGRLSLYE